MAGILTDLGSLYVANAINTRLGAVGVSLALFKTNINPAITDVNATYTGAGVEATFPGYARIPLTTWTVTGPTAHVSFNTELLRVFTTTGASSNMIYGYFLITGAGDVIGAERNPAAPVDMTASGAQYAVVPMLSDKNP